MPAAIERAQEHALHRHADQHNGEGGQEECGPEIDCELEDGDHEDRAKHEEGSMRKTDHIHQAENEGEACRHQEQQHAVDEAVQELSDQIRHWPLTPACSRIAVLPATCLSATLQLPESWPSLRLS